MPTPFGRDRNARQSIRAYIVENLLLGEDELNDGASLVETGILDSTGAMEMVAFLETEFGITVADQDLVPANLDSVERLVAFVTRRMAVIP
jgi:acyl carrier protein